jgi:ABC-type Co2+ transport system permease subunit
MAQTVLQEIEAGALNAVAGFIQANSTAIEADITTGTNDIQAGLTTLFKNIPAVKGVAALFVGPLEATFEAAVSAYVASVIAKYPPAAIVSAVVAFLQAEATKI